MRFVRLIAVEDEFDDTPGLVIKGMNMSLDGLFADREGGTLPHDLLEHQNGAAAIGQVWDEMQAEGAFWFIRGSANGLYEGAAHDLVNMARDSESTGLSNWLTPRTRAHDHDDCFREIIEHARTLIPAELNDPDTFAIDAFLDAALHNMRVGYNKARRRGHGRYQFDAIHSVLHKNSIDFVGQEFILGFGNNEARIREVYHSY